MDQPATAPAPPMMTAAMIRALPLCGHPECAGRGRRTSILDAHRDVVLHHDCDGTRHLFRDDRADGLILTPTPDGWTLTRETYTHTRTATGETWQLIPNPQPICAATWNPDRTQITARHLPTGRVIMRSDSQYELMARAARFYLRKIDEPGDPEKNLDGEDGQVWADRP